MVNVYGFVFKQESSDKHTHTHTNKHANKHTDATKRIISPASRSIINLKVTISYALFTNDIDAV